MLKGSSGDIKCHKLVLARYSQYFRRLFAEKGLKEQDFDVDFDYGNALSDIIDFVYSTILDVDETNIADLAAVASYYEFCDIEFLLADVLPQKITFENSLSLLGDFVRHKLDRMIDAVVPMLAANFQQYNLNELLTVVSPSALAKIMLHSRFPQTVNTDDKLHMIDILCEKGCQMTDQDRVMLSHAVDLSGNGSFQWILDHNCDWLPLDVQKQFLNEILVNRRNILRQLRESSETLEDDKVSRWHALQWMSSVANARMFEEIDAIEFIGTFGGLTNFVNPVQFGFMDLNTSRPLVKYFSGHFIFNRGGHFAAMKMGDENPWIGIRFGQGSKFIVTGFSFDMPSVESWKSERPYPGKIEVVTNGKSRSLFYYEDTKKRMELMSGPVNEVSLTMVEPNSIGGWIFRFSFVHIFGSFTGERHSSSVPFDSKCDPRDCQACTHPSDLDLGRSSGMELVGP